MIVFNRLFSSYNLLRKMRGKERTKQKKFKLLWGKMHPILCIFGIPKMVGVKRQIFPELNLPKTAGKWEQQVDKE